MEEYKKQKQNFHDEVDTEFDRAGDDEGRRERRERTVIDIARDTLRQRKGLKKKVDERRKKEDDAEKAHAFLQKMLRAATDDHASFKAKRPGLEKAKMVGSVVSMLRDPDMAATLLDQNILGVLAGATGQPGWMDVLPNGKLSSLSVRSKLLAELVKLPLSQKHLAECLFGAVLVKLVSRLL